jgi:hypothetical protein
MEPEAKTEPNQLQVLVAQSNLPESKAQFILQNFSDYFKIASEWEVRAKTIVVTSEKQVVDMRMARTGRLFLKEKRLAIENSRKTMKEQIVREGKAIDGIANVLKALIVPIEDYLDKQEHFVEIRQKEQEAKAIEEYNQRIENERIAREKAEAEERERIRIENERLKAEAIERERAAEIERKKQEALLAAQKAAAAKAQAEAEAKRRAIEEKARQEREAAERKAAEERAEHERILAEQRAKAEAEKKAIEEKARQEQLKAQAIADANRKKIEAEKRKQAELIAAQKAKAEAQRKEIERLQATMITCPKCGHRFENKKCLL